MQNGGSGAEAADRAFLSSVERQSPQPSKVVLNQSEPHFKDVCAMLVSCQLLSPSRWHSMRQLERYHPMIEASMSAAGLRMICCRLPQPFLSVAGHEQPRVSRRRDSE